MKEEYLNKIGINSANLENYRLGTDGAIFGDITIGFSF